MSVRLVVVVPELLAGPPAQVVGLLVVAPEHDGTSPRLAVLEAITIAKLKLETSSDVVAF